MPLCFISIGSNIDRENNIRSAIHVLHRKFGILSHSSIYESASVGFTGDAFYNLVSAFHHQDDAPNITQQLKKIETDHNRVRSSNKFSSRTLDIDLLLYGQQIITTNALTLPHNDILKYAFVLEPLAEIAPDLRHPISNISYAQLWQTFDKNKQPQKKLSNQQHFLAKLN